MSNINRIPETLQRAVATHKVSDGLVRIVVEVPPDYKRALKVLAAQHHMSVKDLVMEAIRILCQHRDYAGTLSDDESDTH